MSSYTVGKDVPSYCSKCKLTLSHIIVSMKDTHTISKVKCNTCQTIHAYKDAKSQGTKIKKSSLIPGGKKQSITVTELWEKELRETQKKPKAYSIREKFDIGDLIDHKKFGPGFVQSFSDDNIEVLFRFDIKKLVHNK